MAYTPSNSTGTLNNATDVDLVSPPPGGAAREVYNITFHNADTASVVLTLEYDDGGSKRRLTKQTIAADGEYAFDRVQVLAPNKKLTAKLGGTVTTNQPTFVANWADKT